MVYQNTAQLTQMAADYFSIYPINCIYLRHVPLQPVCIKSPTSCVTAHSITSTAKALPATVSNHYEGPNISSCRFLQPISFDFRFVFFPFCAFPHDSWASQAPWHPLPSHAISTNKGRAEPAAPGPPAPPSQSPQNHSGAPPLSTKPCTNLSKLKFFCPRCH